LNQPGQPHEAANALLGLACQLFALPTALLVQLDGDTVTVLASRGLQSKDVGTSHLPLLHATLAEGHLLTADAGLLGGSSPGSVGAFVGVACSTGAFYGLVCAYGPEPRAVTVDDEGCLRELAATARPVLAAYNHPDHLAAETARDEADRRLRELVDRAEDVRVLRESEARYRALLEVSPDLIAVHIDEHFVYVNPAGARLLGYDDPQALVGLSIGEVVPPSKQDFVAARTRVLAAIDSRTKFAAQDLVRRDGGTVHVEVAGVNVEFGNRHAILIVGRDLTDRFVAAERIRNSERSLRMAQEISGLGSWEVDFATGRALWSETYFKMLGVEVGAVEPSAEQMVLATHPAERPYLEQVLQDWRTFGGAVTFEQCIVRPDGTVRTLLCRAIAVDHEVAGGGRWIGTSQDVTDARAVEHARTAAERMFRSIAETTLDGIVIADAQGRIQLANPAVQEIFGWSTEALIGQSIELLMPDSGLQAHRKGLQRANATGTLASKGRPLEMIAKHQSGIDVPIELSLSSWEGDAGRFYGAVIRDITERRLLARQQAEFLASVSHELRTPLNLITASLDLMREVKLPPERQSRMLEIGAQNAARLRRVVGDMLDAQAMASGQLRLLSRPNQLSEVLSTAVELSRMSFDDAGITLVLVTQDLLIKVDSERLEQVIINLLENARRHAPSGSIVIVNQTLEQDIVRISVSDQGPGVPFESREAVFERFVRLEGPESNTERGVGLGLTICRSIVEAHGGNIWIETTPGGGATFLFTLPRLPT
jgi:PAS domain S-box-containing protein